MKDFLKKIARKDKPGWAAGLSGAVYLLSFLFFPVYSFWQLKLMGSRLLAAAPLAWLMLLCGAMLAVCPLLIRQDISLWVGVGCVVMTGLCGLFGDVVISGDATMAALSIDNHYAGYRPTHTLPDAGYLVSLGAGLVCCALEGYGQWRRRKTDRFIEKHSHRVYRDRNGNELHIG